MAALTFWRNAGSAAALLGRRPRRDAAATQGEAMNATANPAKESLRKEQKQQREAARRRGTDDELDEALKETFPASDPLATQTPIKPGGKDKR